MSGNPPPFPSNQPPSFGGPRLLKGDDIAGTQAGQELQAEQLNKEMKSARNVLLGLSILQMLAGAFFAYLLTKLSGSPKVSNEAIATVTLAVVVVLGMGLTFMGLWFWSAHDPYSACLTGMIIYGLAWAADAAVTAANHPEALSKGIIVKVLILAWLYRGVQAGGRYKKLRAEMASQM